MVQVIEDISRGLPRAVDMEASGWANYMADEAKAETPSGVPWSLPCP